MIYFDNSATGGFKPRSVTDTAENIIRYLSSNPGRSGHRLSVAGANIVFDTRKLLADFFKGTPDRVVFTKNCTEALNIAIFGSVKKGGHIVTTCLEHNSVLRPLTHLQNEGLITFTAVSPKDDDYLSAIKNAVKENTYMIITTSISNVTGEVLPIEEIGDFATQNNLLYLVDGAQGGGHINLTLDSGIDMIALAGHKGLYGIMGSGVLIFKEKVSLSPLLFGGTGTESNNLNAPEVYPERLECGTLNLPAIASLFEGVRYVKNNIENFSKTLINYSEEVIYRLNKIDSVKVYSNKNPAGIVSFSVGNTESMDVADILSKKYDIAVRGGLHCAPLIHRKLNTVNSGLVRVSMSAQNSQREIDALISAISQIAKNKTISF